MLCITLARLKSESKKHQLVFVGHEPGLLVDDRDIPKPQRLPTHKPLQDWITQAASREAGLYQAHTQGGLSMTRIAQTLGLSVSRVSRLIKQHERAAGLADSSTPMNGAASGTTTPQLL